MLLTNLLSLVGFLIFYQLCREESGKRCAGLALLLLICWPTGFFFSIPYTESLFLFLSVGLFYALRHGQMRWVALFAFLLPLCKAVGFLILIPLACHLWERKRPCKEWLHLLSPVLGSTLIF
jgi:Gpi18-like mannosyltransferase